MEDFKKALDGFVPTAMSGVTKGGSNQKDAKASFDTIGGMEEAKALLEKLLLLPTKVRLKMRIFSEGVCSPEGHRRPFCGLPWSS